jgi:hypothetical protein
MFALFGAMFFMTFFLENVHGLGAVEAAPVPAGTPAPVAELITNVTHATFIGGMNAAFLVASIVALADAGIALLTKRGHAVEGAAVI